MLAITLDACRVHLADTDLEPGEGRELVVSLAEAARECALPALEQACLMFAETLRDRGGPGGGDGSAEEHALVADWIDAMGHAVSGPSAASVAEWPGALSALLCDRRCAAPLDADDIEALRAMLEAPPAISTGASAPPVEPDLPTVDEAPELPAGLAELVSLLGQELDPLAALVDEALDAVDAQVLREAGEHVAEQVECFAAAAEAAGLEGLQRACEQLAGAWHAFSRAGRGGVDVPAVDPAALRAAHAALAGYVSRPFHRAPSERLVGALLALGAAAGLDRDAAGALRDLLGDAGAVRDTGEGEPERIVAASPDLISLEIPNDVPAELLDTLLQELPLITEAFSGAVARLALGGTLEDVNVALRAAHTLKGAANTVGVAGPAHLTHHVEDALRAYFEAEAIPAGAVVDELVRVADCLEAMSEAISGAGPAPDDALEVLQRVLDLANRIDLEGLDRVAATPVGAAGAAPAASREPPSGPTATASADRSPASTESAPVRVPAALIDEFMRLTGETIILTGQVQERLTRTMDGARTMQGQLGTLQQLGYELEQFIDLGNAPVAGARATNDPLFDPLEMDEYNELHTLSRRMVEAAADAREMGRAVEAQLHALTTMLADQGRLNRESHERVLETRMVPVSTVVSRLQRSVRQAARTTGKTVTLEVTGAQTRMDAEVLSELVDPLMHVLRNAVDHGIEPPPERLAAGKPAAGVITLEFARAGNHVVVRCIDDGAGIDDDAVRAAAVERGRIGAGEPLGDEGLRRLILEPGFSTRASATQVSGRGIGLDAVYGRVLALGGTFDLETRRGAGCTIELGVPLTLISAHALLVRVRHHVFALAARGIEQILHGDSGTLESLGSRRIYRTGDTAHEAILLDSLLVLPPDARTADREPRTAVLTQTERGPVAVMVQEVIDSRDLVVKNLGRYVPRVRGIVGATILGDGSVTPVLDLPDLLRSDTPASIEGIADASDRVSQTVSLPTALVVDDSLSARRSLERVMADSGYEVRTARDGVEAVEILDGMHPDVMLVDMEMPRMNGLELVAHLRASVATAGIPVVMVTSRSTAKHREQAERAGVDVYLTKPFSEDELLGHVATLHECA